MVVPHGLGLECGAIFDHPSASTYNVGHASMAVTCIV